MGLFGCCLHAPTKLLTCFTSFCRALTAFVQLVTAFTDLRGTLSALAKPLPDFTSLWGMLIMSLEPLQAFTSQRAAKCSYQTFTSLHKPLHGSNCTCRILYEPLREANSTYQISNWFYNLFQGAKLHLKNH